VTDGVAVYRVQVEINDDIMPIPDGAVVTAKGSSYSYVAPVDDNSAYLWLPTGSAVISVPGYTDQTVIVSATNGIQNDVTFDTVDIGTSTDIEVSDLASLEYNAIPLTQTITVTNAGIGQKLTEDTDYTVSYANNTNAGTATVTITGKGVHYTGKIEKTFTITARPITIDSIKVEDKIYDGNVSAKLDFTLGHLVGSDAPFYTLVPTATFDSKAAGDKTVTATFVLQTTDAVAHPVSNYAVPSSVPGLPAKAKITPKSVSVAGYEVKSKVYDGTTKAEFVNTPTITGAIAGDQLALAGGVPTFSTAVAGNNIPITFTSFTLAGNDSGNYALLNPQPTGVTANITAVAKTPVTGIVITGDTATQFIYKLSGVNTKQLAAGVSPQDATDKTVTWSSSNDAIAGVSQTGLVTFKGKEGTVTIKAAANDGSGKFGTKVYTVKRNVTSIGIPLTKIYLKKGQSLTLPVVLYDGSKETSSKLTWKSSKKSVAKVTAAGKVTAVKKGTAKVTVTTANGKKKTVTVHVLTKATTLKSLKVTFPKKNTLKKGKTYTLKIALSPSTATDVKLTFKSSKSSVLKVNKAGKLTAVKKGKATITVKAGSKSVKKTITVK
jgi:uncharacterized protein YjdB